MDKATDDEHYFEILLKQYSECWEDIRDYSRQVWQIPAVLIAIISFIGILYSTSVSSSHVGRIATLLLALGFTLISFVALKKHRFFSDRRVENFNDIQQELKNLLKQDEYKNKVKDIKWKTSDFREAYCINATSAYKWQYGLVMAILIGILILLGHEINSIISCFVLV